MFDSIVREKAKVVEGERKAIFVPREVIWKVGEFSLNTYFWMKYHYRVYIFCIDNSFPFFIPRFTVRFQKIIENSLVFGEKI